MSRSGKKLSTFDFERQNIAGCCKQSFQFHFNKSWSKAKQDFFSFLKKGAKIQVSTPIPPSFIKSLGLY